jgi:UDP-glucose 4-epimerase
MMKNVLITGGAGFVGSHLVEALLKENMNILVVDNLSTGNLKNLESHIEKINLIKFDISQTDWSELDYFKPDTIFHLATHPRSFSLTDPIKNTEVNAKGMINVLEFAKKHQSRVIYTSNSGICGDPLYFPINEDHPIDCKTPYDANKFVGELYAKIYYQIHGVYSIIFRLATVYGERQIVNEQFGWRPLVPSLVKSVLSNEIPKIQWDGKQTRDLIYVKDVVDCLVKGAKSKGQGGEMFLLSTNVETSVNDTLKIICELTNKKVNPIYEEKNPGDLRRMMISFDKANKHLGYSPKVSLNDGIKQFIDWYKNSETS